MKILIVSDSHSRLDNLMKIWEKEVPDIVISAGDYSKDVEELSYVYESYKYYIVRGNCDYMDHNTEDTSIPKRSVSSQLYGHLVIA